MKDTIEEVIERLMSSNYTDLSNHGDIEYALRAAYLAGAAAREAEVKQIIEKARYSYTNYMTQMSSKKNYEIGNIVNEFCKEFLSALGKS